MKKKMKTKNKKLFFLFETKGVEFTVGKTKKSPLSFSVRRKTNWKTWSIFWCRLNPTRYDPCTVLGLFTGL